MSKKEYANEDLTKQFNNIKTLIKLLCLEKEIKQKISNNSEIPQAIDYKMIFVKTNLIKKYKEIMNYKELINIFDNNNSILNCVIENNKINYNNLNEEAIANIINQLPKELVNKIENVDKKKLITEIKIENIKEWKFKYKQIKREKEIIIKYLDDFEIINTDILNSIKNQGIEINDFFYSDCIFTEQKVFFALKDKNCFWYEIGYYFRSRFKAEYLFDKNEIEDENAFIKEISKIGIKNLISSINQNAKEQKILIGNKDINIFKLENNEILIKHKPGGGLMLFMPARMCPDNTRIIKKNIKGLALLSIFLKKTENIYNNKEIIKKNKEDLYLLNGQALENPCYKEVNKFVNENELIQKKINDINLADLSLDYIDKLFDEIDKNKLNELEKNEIIKKSTTLFKGPFEPKVRLIEIAPKKYLEVYIDFVIITKRILIELTNIFNFHAQKQSFDIESFENNEIIKLTNRGKNNYGIFFNKTNEINESNSDKNLNNNNMIKIIELMEKLEAKEKELKEFKSKLPFELNKDEEIMTIIIKSDDQKILFPIICKNTDIFTRLENELYKVEEYKDYKEEENFFLINGRKINKYDTLEQNGIKNNDIVLLVKIENDI